MRKWRWVLVVVILFLVSSWYLVFRENGPTYQGRSLSYWFNVYCTDDHGAEIETSLNAFKSLGTNALSYLVKEALSSKQDSKLRKMFYGLLEKFPHSWHLPRYVARSQMREAASLAIFNIQPSSQEILPFLTDALNSPDIEKHLTALRILHMATGWDSKTALAFAKGLLFEDAESRKLALEYLSELGTNAAAAIPCLRIGFQNEKDWASRSEIASVLCRMDGNETNALQFLMNGLKQPDQEIYANFIGTGTGVPALIIHAPGRENRGSFAAWQIGLAGSNAQAAIPALMEAMDGTDFALQTCAFYALYKIGAPRELYFPKVKQRLKSTDEYEQVNAASLVLLMDPNDRDSRALLTKFVKAHSEVERAALRILIELPGPLDDEIKDAVDRALASSDETQAYFLNVSLELRKKQNQQTNR